MTGGPSGGWPLRRYMALFVVALLVVAFSAGVLVRTQAEKDARQAAADDTSFAAHHAVAQLKSGFDIARAATAPLLTPAGEAQLFGPGCRLSLTPIGAFTTGHMDVIRTDGSVQCSSTPASTGPVAVFAGQSWMSTSTPLVVAPVIDPSTGQEVAIAVYPFPGRGVLAWFFNLAPVGPTLLSEFGSGAHQLEFMVTTGDGKTVIARSTAAPAWVGRSLEGTAFAAARNGLARPDPGGTRRIYSETPMPATGWRLYVGADEAAAMASADQLANQGATIILGGVAVMLVLTFVMHRRIAEPVRLLTERVRRASAGLERDVDILEGAAEVATLLGEFDELMASFNRELSARLKGEAAAQVSARDYRTLFAGHPQPMWLYDTNTLKFLEVNDAAIAAYGYSRDEFMQMTIAEIRPAEDVAKFKELLPDVPLYDRTGPWRHVCKDGTVLQVLITSHSITFDGQAARFVMAESLTEVQRLEAELNQTRARIDASTELDRMKDELVSMVSHELRTPLASVVGFAELLMTRPVTDLQRQEYLAVMLQQGRRLNALINDFLDLQRIEAGRQQMALSPTDLTALIKRAVNHAGVDETTPIEVQIAEPLPLAMVDSDAIYRVLENLISNARKYSPQGGEISIGAASVDSMIEVFVKDRGLGIPREAMSMLTEKFYRVDTSDRRQMKGTGLGLAISKRIVEGHGGAVSVRSDGPGLGSIFTFTVPIAPEVAKTGDVLVIEDDAGFAHLLEVELATKGLTTVWASDGETAEELLREGKVRAVVMDLRLPGIQGEDFLVRLRELHGPDMPVVILSVKSLDATQALALQKSGVTAILLKGAGAAKTATEMVAQILITVAAA